MFRRLRGLRVQLLLWTIFPLAAALIVLSLAGVTRHRQVMAEMVETRDRSLALAEAHRLEHVIERHAATLSRLANADAAATPPDPFSGLAQWERGTLTALAGDAADWLAHDAVSELAARAAASDVPQYAEGTDPLRLWVAVAAPGGRALVGALPLAALDLAEFAQTVETGSHGALFLIGRDGQPVYAHTPHGLPLAVDDLPALPPGAADAPVSYVDSRCCGRLQAVAVPVSPPGWTLVTLSSLANGAMGLSVVDALPLTLLFVAVIALLAVSFGVANVVRPLQELSAQASRLAWGDFDAVQTPVGGVQEMDDLRATLAQLAERIRAYQEGMRDYLSAVTRAQEEERYRLAHELHDETVQALIALKQRAQLARKRLEQDPARASQPLDELMGVIDEQLAALRRLIGDLRPVYLEDLGFLPALQALAQTSEARHGLTITLTVTGEAARIAPDLELAAFRIMQQALNNAIAHAHARHVALNVAFSADSLGLEVRDDGQGFTPPEQPSDLARAGHFGLMGMHERATLYGGQLHIVSAPGQGTTVSARLPLR